MAASLKKEISERMRAQNLSIPALERKAGLSVHAVRNILKGRIKNPRARSLQAIADALECSILDLIKSSSRKIRLAEPLKINTIITSPLENLEFMSQCFETVMKIMKEKEFVISVDNYFECIALVYSYSLKEDPKILDLKFTKWVIDNQLSMNCHSV